MKQMIICCVLVHTVLWSSSQVVVLSNVANTVIGRGSQDSRQSLAAVDSDKRTFPSRLQAAGTVLASFVVNDLGDASDANPGDGICETQVGNGLCSLRAAIESASDNDTITFSVTGIISVASVLAVSSNINIIGPGSLDLVVDGGGSTTVLFVENGRNVSISGIAISNGNAAIIPNDLGGGIWNRGTLTVAQIVLTNNLAGARGGGIFNEGALLITDSLLSNNAAPSGGGISNFGILEIVNSTLAGNSAQRGGGIWNMGTLDVSDTTFAGNTANLSTNGHGGAIYQEQSALPPAQINRVHFADNEAPRGGALSNVSTHGISITDCTWVGNESENGGAINNSGFLEVTGNTFAGNSANLGGAIFNGSELNVINSTISGNSANEGGGIYSFAILYIAHSTLAGNSALQGGGIRNAFFGLGFESLTLYQTLLKGGALGTNLASDKMAPMTSIGYNLSDDNGGGLFTGPGDVVNVDPVIGPLQSNGGPTQTHALLAGSPAIDTGDPNFAAPPSFDQRGTGYLRILDGDHDSFARVDIGAYELLAPTAASVTIGGRVTDSLGRWIYGVRVTLTDKSGEQRSAITNPFGYYRFDGVIAGGSYIVGAFSRRHMFAVPQILVTADSDIADLDFVAKGP